MVGLGRTGSSGHQRSAQRQRVFACIAAVLVFSIVVVLRVLPSLDARVDEGEGAGAVSLWAALGRSDEVRGGYEGQAVGSWLSAQLGAVKSDVFVFSKAPSSAQASRLHDCVRDHKVCVVVCSSPSVLSALPNRIMKSLRVVSLEGDCLQHAHTPPVPSIRSARIGWTFAPCYLPLPSKDRLPIPPHHRPTLVSVQLPQEQLVGAEFAPPRTHTALASHQLHHWHVARTTSKRLVRSVTVEPCSSLFVVVAHDTRNAGALLFNALSCGAVGMLIRPAHAPANSRVCAGPLDFLEQNNAPVLTFSSAAEAASAVSEMLEEPERITAAYVEARRWATVVAAAAREWLLGVPDPRAGAPRTLAPPHALASNASATIEPAPVVSGHVFEPIMLPHSPPTGSLGWHVRAPHWAAREGAEGGAEGVGQTGGDATLPDSPFVRSAVLRGVSSHVIAATPPPRVRLPPPLDQGFCECSHNQRMREDQRQAREQATHPLSKVSMLVLDNGVSLSLHVSLRSWKVHGLMEAVGEKVLFVQGIDDGACEFGLSQGLLTIGHLQNVGIVGAFGTLLNHATLEFVLFLERDWNAVAPKADNLDAVAGASFLESLASAQRLIVGGQADVVTLQYRQPTNKPDKCTPKELSRVLWCRTRSQCSSQKLTHGKYVFDSAIQTLNYCVGNVPKIRTFLDVCSEEGVAGAPEFACFPSNNAHWSNNPSLYTKRFADEYLVPWMTKCDDATIGCYYHGIERNREFQSHIRGAPLTWAYMLAGIFNHVEAVTDTVSTVTSIQETGQCAAGCSVVLSQPRECECFRAAEVATTASRTWRLVPGLKVVSVSSDDWGRGADGARVVWPNQRAKESSKSSSASSSHKYDCGSADNADELRVLADWLNALNENANVHQRVVVTANWVVGGPSTTKASTPTQCSSWFGARLCEYPRWSIADDPSSWATSLPPYDQPDLHTEYQRLFREQLVHPEYHGRSHLETGAWLRAVNTGERDTVACLREGLVCSSSVSKPHKKWGENHFVSAEYSDQESLWWFEDWVRSGIEEFSQYWGYRPSTTIPPNNRAPCGLARVFYRLGFIAIDGKEPVRVSKDERCVPYQGEEHRISALARLSQVDLVYDTPTPLGAGAGEQWLRKVRRKSLGPFTLLEVHTANWLGSVTRPSSVGERLELLRRYISGLRVSPKTVFTTSSELHQVRLRGWSVEVWFEELVFRNYRTLGVRVKVPPLEALFAAHEAARLRQRCTAAGKAWVGRVVSEAVRGNSKSFGEGDEIDLPSMQLLRLRIACG